MAIVQAGITLYQQNDEFKARLMASGEKPDNPRLIALVPDPEKRNIFKSVMSLLSRDSSKYKSTEDLKAWGGLGAKVRNKRLDPAIRKKIASEAAKARWANKKTQDTK